mgnify:CR=1 FL=1
MNEKLKKLKKEYRDNIKSDAHKYRLSQAEKLIKEFMEFETKSKVKRNDN